MKQPSTAYLLGQEHWDVKGEWMNPYLPCTPEFAEYDQGYDTALLADLFSEPLNQIRAENQERAARWAVVH